MIKKTNLLLLFALYSMSCSSRPAYKISDHYNGKTFHMPGLQTPVKSFLSVIKWKLQGSGEAWPEEITPPHAQSIPVESTSSKMIITFVNHSTFLIQVDGLNILTDPIWARRASPVSFAGPERVHAPGIAFNQLPRIDAVIISHNHYDHMNEETINQLEIKYAPKFIVPLANAKKMQSFGAKNVVELDWWESINLTPEVKITLTPAKHWSARTLSDRQEALWGAYYINTKKHKIYFAGDTGYGPHFLETEKKMGAPDVAFLPIGAYEPRWFMKDAHTNPEEAVLASLDLRARYSIGMHFGTFKLSGEAIDTPEKDLQMAMDKLKVKNFLTLSPGKTFEL